MKILLHFYLLIFCGTIVFAVQKDKQFQQPEAHQKKQLWKYSTAGRVDVATGIVRAQYQPDAHSSSGSDEEIARMYLRSHHAMFGISEYGNDLTLQAVQESPAGRHVRLHQTYEGIPVYRADIVVSINKNKRITFVMNNAKQFKANVNTAPLLDAATVSTLAFTALNIQGKVLGEESPQLYIYAEEELPRLSYRTVISTNNPRGVWEIFVDANTGEIIRRKDIAIYEKKSTNVFPATGSGYVFNPDPLTSANVPYGNAGYTDGNDATNAQLNAQRVLIKLQDITLSGNIYSLEGPYVTVDDWDTPNIPVVLAADPDSFRFTRNQTGFEDVSLYYFLDSTQRYIQSLGYTNIQNLSIHADPHGFDSSDNAFFDPSSNRLSFGQGGVDDAEDADVILHEYGHAIHEGTVPGWGGGEEGALGEGFGDYWAVTYSRNNNPTFSRNFFPTWDAGFNGTSGSVWGGRKLNDSRTYPEGGVAEIEVHDAGQIWSTMLMILWDTLGKETMDQLVLQSHFYMGTSGTMRDNAIALLQADNDLFFAEHESFIVRKLYERNFLPKPSIRHTSLRDNENIATPFSVTANVLDGYFPIDTLSVKVIWGRNGSFTDTASLHQVDFSSLYAGEIPSDGQPALYRYYFIASDTLGTTVKFPDTAPSAYFSFYAGPDTIKPRVHHIPLYNQAFYTLPPVVKVTARDNLGIDSVFVEYKNRRSLQSGMVLLPHTHDSTYENSLPVDTVTSQLGDTIEYSITVLDSAMQSNIVRMPGSATYQFRVTSGNILLVRDDTTKTAPVSSFDLFYSTIAPSTYVVDTIKWANFGAQSLTNYNLIIVASGLNVYPLAQTSYRDRLLDFLSSGGKVLTEGGEVGHFYRKGGPFDAAPAFRRLILRDSSWYSNAVGSNLNIGTPVHRIFSSPNVLTSPIAFTNRTSGNFAADRDAMTLNPAESRTVTPATWSGLSSYGGMFIYTPPSQQAPQTIFFAFALSSITDTSVAKKLVANAVSTFFPRSQITGAVDEIASYPASFSLAQNYPNPFNPATVIRYSLSVHSTVSLKIYDMLGREVATLVDGLQHAGEQQEVWNAVNLPSGVYYYRLSVFDSKTKEMLYQRVEKAMLLK